MSSNCKQRDNLPEMQVSHEPSVGQIFIIAGPPLTSVSCSDEMLAARCAETSCVFGATEAAGVPTSIRHLTEQLWVK
jgi:hypothetical protein